MFVVCDTFDYSDFPDYASTVEDAKLKHSKYVNGENMTRLMEIYDLRLPLQEQICVGRHFAAIQ